MKKILVALALTLSLLALVVNAQTVTNTTLNASGGTTTTISAADGSTSIAPAPAPTLQSDLSTLEAAGKVVEKYLGANTNAIEATDWTFFASYTKASGGVTSSGASFGAVYYFNQYVGTQVRLQYLDTGAGGGLNAVLLPNGAITLSSAYIPIKSAPWFVIRPMAESGGAINLNGGAYAILGGGTEVDLYSTKTATAVFQRLSVFYGIEKWAGSENFNLTHYGGAVNFNLESIVSKVEGWFTAPAK